LAKAKEIDITIYMSIKGEKICKRHVCIPTFQELIIADLKQLPTTSSSLYITQ